MTKITKKKFDISTPIFRKRGLVASELEALEVGEGVCIEGADRHTLSANIYNIKKRSDMRFVTRTIDGKVFTIRTE